MFAAAATSSLSRALQLMSGVRPLSEAWFVCEERGPLGSGRPLEQNGIPSRS